MHAESTLNKVCLIYEYINAKFLCKIFVEFSYTNNCSYTATTYVHLSQQTHLAIYIICTYSIPTTITIVSIVITIESIHYFIYNTIHTYIFIILEQR